MVINDFTESEIRKKILQKVVTKSENINKNGKHWKGSIVVDVYRIDEQYYKTLSRQGFDREVLDKLKCLVDREYVSQQDFFEYLKKLLEEPLFSRCKYPIWTYGVCSILKLVSTVKIPNDHNRMMKQSKSKYIADDLKLTHEQFNDLINCPLKMQGYLQIISDQIKNGDL